MIGVFGKLRWSTMVLGVLSLTLAVCGALLLRVYAYAFVSDPSPADAAIVLGAAVWGSSPSPVFEERIKHGIHLYQEGRIDAIIFTGGLSEGDQLAESEAAKEYALARGVPGEHIYLETLSRTTYENIEQALKIVRQQGFTRVLIVSDPLHMRRAVTMARDLGLDAHPSPTPTSRYTSWRTRLRFLLRETYFYARYLVSIRPGASFAPSAFGSRRSPA